MSAPMLDVRPLTRERVGPYRVVRRIGSGGMASVYEAEDAVLGHRVAIKLLHPHIREKPGAAERFLREGRAAARVRHPHVVQVHALGEDGGSPYLAMELLEGRDLAAILASEKRLSIERALDLLLPVMDAVAAAHDAGVIHRDLKPSNIFIATGPNGLPWPKVVDFGISKLTINADAKNLTATDAVVGTAAYMAPEQARAVRNATFRSDQYALAVNLYECITGQQPFAQESLYEILQAIMTAPVPPPSAHASDIPGELDAIVLRAMSRDPGERFASVRELGAALLPFASTRARLAWSAECAASLESSEPSHHEAAFAPTDEAPPPGRTAGTLAAGTVENTRQSAHRRARRRVASVALPAMLALLAAAGVGLRWRAATTHASTPVALESRLNAPIVAPVDPPREPSPPSAPPFETASLHATPPSQAATAPSPPQPHAQPEPTASTRRTARPSPAVARPDAGTAAHAARAESPSPAHSASTAAAQVPLGDNNAPILP